MLGHTDLEIHRRSRRRNGLSSTYRVFYINRHYIISTSKLKQFQQPAKKTAKLEATQTNAALKAASCLLHASKDVVILTVVTNSLSITKNPHPVIDG